MSDLAIPSDAQGAISGVRVRGAGQETAVLASVQEDVLGLHPMNVWMEPPTGWNKNDQKLLASKIRLGHGEHNHSGSAFQIINEVVIFYL